MEDTDNKNKPIQLSSRNMISGQLPTKQKLLCVIDSGASKSLLSETTLKRSEYLSSLEKIPCVKIPFQCANGQCVVPKYAVKFVIQLDTHKIELTAMVIDTLGTIDLLIGTQSLSELDAQLCFTSNKLKLKSRSIPLKFTTSLHLKPGESRRVELVGKLPPFLRNSNVHIKSYKALAKVAPTDFLAQLHKGRTNMMVCNMTEGMVKFDNKRPVAMIELDSIDNFYQKIYRVHKGNDKTIMFCNESDARQHFMCGDLCSMQAIDSKTETQYLTDQNDREELYKIRRNKYSHLDPQDERLRMTDQEVIDQTMSVDKTSLTCTADKQRLRQLLYKYKEAFSLMDQVGDCTDCEVDFTLSDDKPFMIKPYIVSPADIELVEKEVDKLIKLGVVSVGSSNYTSPLMILAKPGTKEKRAVVDYRHLNSKISKYNLSTSLVKHAMHRIGMSECTIMSKIDLKAAFHSLRLSKRAQKYTGVSTWYGGPTLIHKKLPMGLGISPSIFAEKIREFLQEIPSYKEFTECIADDILIFSKTKEDHFKHLEAIFSMLERKGLRLSPRKAELFQTKVTFFGHHIMIKDNRPCQLPMGSKVSAINELRPPKTVTQVKQFVGAVTFLSQYVAKLQVLLKPIHSLTRKGAQFEWSEQCQSNFDEIKAILMSEPCLTLPRRYGLLRLYTDASIHGCGAALYQIQDNRERLISYFSKSFRPEVAKGMSITELELSGLVAATKAFKYILSGTSFEVYCDHKSLINILKSPSEPVSARMKRLLYQLSDLDFKIGWVAGKSLVVPDMLSRNANTSDDPSTLVPIALHVSEEGIFYCCDDKVVQSAGENMSQPAIQDIMYPTVEAGRPITRGMARSQNIVVPDLKDSIRQLPTRTRRTKQPTETDNGPEVRQTGLIDTENNEVSHPRPQPTEAIQVDHTIQTEEEDRARPLRQQIRQRHQPTISDNELHPVPGIFHKDRKQLIDDASTSQILTKRIPRQSEIDSMLELVKSKVLKDYHLPMSRREIRAAQLETPMFKEVIQYLESGIVPSTKRAIKRVQAKAEDYAMIQGVLFRLHPTSDKKDVKVTLAVPDKYVPYILHLHHDSLVGCHQGVSRTYQTIKRSYFVPSLYEKLVSYIRSCTTCSSFKSAQNKEKEFNQRIPQNYRPFSELHMDVKYMCRSVRNYEMALICVDPFTRFVKAFPMRARTAVAIGEMVVQNIVLEYGLPDRIIYDEDACFLNSLMAFIHKTLGIKQIFVSPENHQSNCSERHIGTVTRFLMNNLKDSGNNWDLYLKQVCFSYNIFACPTLGGYSPWTLVYGRDPPSLTGITVEPLQGVSRDYRDYAELFKQRLQKLDQCVVDLQTKVQSERAHAQSNKVRDRRVYKVGDLVSLFAPRLSTLNQTGRKKLTSRFVGPLIVADVLDSDKVILETLEGQRLRHIFNTNRLKMCFVRTSAMGNCTNSLDKLREVLQPQTTATQSAYRKYDIVDEHGKKLTLPTDAVQLTGKGSNLSTNIAMYCQHAEENNGIAANQVLNVGAKKRLLKKAAAFTNEGIEWDITKARFKEACLEVFVQNPETTTHGVWINLEQHPYLFPLIRQLLTKGTDKWAEDGTMDRTQTRQRLTNIKGSIKKYLHKVYGIHDRIEYKD